MIPFYEKRIDSDPEIVSKKKARRWKMKDMVSDNLSEKARAAGRKFGNIHKIRIVQLYAEYKTDSEVAKAIKEEFGLVVRPKNLARYKRVERWRPFLERFREQYLSKLTDVAIANQKIRLDRLEKMYQEAAKDKKVRVSARKRAELREVLSSARQEMALNKESVHNMSVTNIQLLSNEELEQRRQQYLDQLKNSKVLEVENARTD